MTEAVLFWVLAVVSVAGAIGMVAAPKAVYSAIFLASTMISLAVLYIAQDALFLGIVQVVVYTGAVMMLFLFVLMIIGVDSADSLVETIRGQRIAAIVVGAAFGLLLIAGIGNLSVAGFTGLAGTPGQSASSLAGTSGQSASSLAGTSGQSASSLAGTSGQSASSLAGNSGQSASSLAGTSGQSASSLAAANAGGNVEGLAALIFTRYLWAFELTSALLITAALGAMVLAHRERFGRRKNQRELAIERFAEGGHPTPLPNPGVYARHNAVDVPAVLPDGSPAESSVASVLPRRPVPATPAGRSKNGALN